MPCFISSCQEHGFSPAIFQDAPLQTRIDELFLQQELGRKVFSLPGDSSGKWSMGNDSLGTCGKTFGGLHPCLSFFYLLHLCCSSNQNPQLKSQQIGLYDPEVGERKAVLGERPPWSPGRDLPGAPDQWTSSTTPYYHAPPCPLAGCAGCAGMSFLDFLAAFCLYPQHQPPLLLPPSLSLILGLGKPHTSCSHLQLGFGVLTSR